MATKSAKAQLRRTLRARRAALAPADQARAAERLAAHVTGTRVFRVSRRIACYLAHDGEIDPYLVIDRVWELRKTCYLPLLSRVHGDALWFAPAQPGTALAPNRFGILEPAVATRALVRARSLDLMLLPLVAFDDGGNRLGMGAGFYDRTLAFLRHHRHWRKPRLVGLAHELQRVPRLDTDSWDIALQAIVTDERVHLVPRACSA